MKQLITPFTRMAIFACCLVMCIQLHAQTYSVDECVKLALENSPDIKNRELAVEAATYHIREVKSALLPTVNLTGQTLYYRDLPAQYAPASAFGGPEGSYQKLTLSMAQTTSLNIQMTQNLYNHAAITGLKAARVYQEAVVIKAEMGKEDLAYSVMATYYSIQVLNENLDRLRENIENLEKTTALSKVLKDNDLVSGNSYNRMQINLENLRNQYETQKLVQSENITLLKFLMNVEVGRSLQLEGFNYSGVLKDSAQTDISQRSDIRLQQVNIRLAHFDKKVIAAGYYPTLTNTFSYGYTGYYDSFSPFKQINDDWIKTSYIALTLRVPVFDGFQKKNQLRQKEIAIRQNMNSLESLKLSANKEIEDALQNYTINKTLFRNTSSSLTLAEQLFSSSRTEYENGITSLTDLLNAQNDLSNARNNYSSALLNLRLAELALRKANGTIISKS